MYVFAGRSDSIALSDLRIYDPITNTWDVGVSDVVGMPRWVHSAVVLGDIMYVFGGTNGAQILNDLRIYNPSEGSPKPTMRVFFHNCSFPLTEARFGLWQSFESPEPEIKGVLARVFDFNDNVIRVEVPKETEIIKTAGDIAVNKDKLPLSGQVQLKRGDGELSKPYQKLASFDPVDVNQSANYFNFAPGMFEIIPREIKQRDKVSFSGIDYNGSQIIDERLKSRFSGQSPKIELWTVRGQFVPDVNNTYGDGLFSDLPRLKSAMSDILPYDYFYSQRVEWLNYPNRVILSNWDGVFNLWDDGFNGQDQMTIFTYSDPQLVKCVGEIKEENCLADKESPTHLKIKFISGRIKSQPEEKQTYGRYSRLNLPTDLFFAGSNIIDAVSISKPDIKGKTNIVIFVNTIYNDVENEFLNAQLNVDAFSPFSFDPSTEVGMLLAKRFGNPSLSYNGIKRFVKDGKFLYPTAVGKELSGSQFFSLGYVSPGRVYLIPGPPEVSIISYKKDYLLIKGKNFFNSIVKINGKEYKAPSPLYSRLSANEMRIKLNLKDLPKGRSSLQITNTFYGARGPVRSREYYFRCDGKGCRN
jgi:hypothetical protein